MTAATRLASSLGVRTIRLVAIVALALTHGCHPASSLEREDASVVFVCRNGVAMSVWSALTFERLAAEHGLHVRAASRASAATFTDVPLNMRLALAYDGYRVGDYRPHVISAADVGRAERVILIDTELPPSAGATRTTVEHWRGFPPMRERYYESRAALQQRVEDLVARLAQASDQPPRD